MSVSILFQFKEKKKVISGIKRTKLVCQKSDKYVFQKRDKCIKKRHLCFKKDTFTFQNRDIVSK